MLCLLSLSRFKHRIKNMFRTPPPPSPKLASDFDGGEWVPMSSTISHNSSVRSHFSVPYIGVYPVGTLRIHEAPSQPTSMDEEPPPLADSPPPSPPLRHDGPGDVVLVVDLPEVFLVGYDCVSFTAKHFLGIRDIPAGPHFFWLATPDGVSTRSGFWILGSKEGGRVHVVQWDTKLEIATQPLNVKCQARAEDIVKIHDKLVPYDQPETVGGGAATFDAETALETWKQVASDITESVLDRVIGGEMQRNNPVWFVHTTDRVDGVARDRSEMELDRRISFFPLQRDLKFSFRQLDGTFSLQSRGSDRTKDATDASSYLSHLMMSKRLHDEDILGEMQLSYLIGTYLGSDACIQQWWHMVEKIMLKAFHLVDSAPELVESFLRVLAAQITHSSKYLESGGSIFDQAMHTRTRDLRVALTVYKIRLDEFLLAQGSNVNNAQLAAGAACHRIEAVVSKHLDWDLRAGYLRRGKVMLEDGEEVELELDELQGEDERGEFAPEVVDLDESGRQKDLVSWTD